MKSFTLIEVLVSVIIIFLASYVFFSFTSNSFNLYSVFERHKYFTLKSSVVFCEEKGGNLKEVLKDFNIKNDKVLKSLNTDVFLDKSIDFKTDFNKSSVILYKLKAYNKFSSCYIYSLGVK